VPEDMAGDFVSMPASSTSIRFCALKLSFTAFLIIYRKVPLGLDKPRTIFESFFPMTLHHNPLAGLQRKFDGRGGGGHVQRGCGHDMDSFDYRLRFCGRLCAAGMFVFPRQNLPQLVVVLITGVIASAVTLTLLHSSRTSTLDDLLRRIEYLDNVTRHFCPTRRQAIQNRV